MIETTLLLLQAPAPVSPIAPAAILALCVVAGVGTVLLLPSRREASLRTVGAVILLATGLIFPALVVHAAAGAAGVGIYFWVFAGIAIVSAVRVVTHTKPVYSALYFVLTVFASAGLFLLMRAEFMAAALILIYAGAILITYVFVIMLASEAASTGAFTDHDTVSRDPIFVSAIGFALMGVILFVIFDKYQAISKPAVSSIGSVPQWDSSAYVSNATTNPAFILQTSQLTVYPIVVAPSSMNAAIDSFKNPDGTYTWDFSGSSMQGGTQQLGAFLFTNQLINLELAGLILTIAMVGAIVIARRRIQVGVPDSEEVVLGLAIPIDDDPHSIPVYGTTNPRQKAYPET